LITVTRGYQFSASHRLHLDSMNDAENDELYGKCNNPFGHGHNYRLEVTVAGPVHGLTGQIVPGEQLDRLVKDAVLCEFDHRYLNVDLPEFGRLVPTTENVLAVVAERLQKRWPEYIAEPIRLYRIHIQETDRNGFELVLPEVQPSSQRPEA
jgi:6-pyruvoyltetrahydropterin/6-carboxytetrahydropterin synthase